MTYVRFQPANPAAGFPEGSIAVVSTTRGNALGVLLYFPRWRQWVMEAAPDTVWSHDCLSDVAAKLRELNAAGARPARGGA